MIRAIFCIRDSYIYETSARLTILYEKQLFNDNDTHTYILEKNSRKIKISLVLLRLVST